MIVYLRWISFSLLYVSVPSVLLAADGVVSEAEASGNYGLLSKVMLALAVVIALFMALMWLLKRLQGGHVALQGDLTLEQRLPVGAHHAVVVLRRGSRRWLVGISNDGIRRIDQWDEPGSVDITIATTKKKEDDA